MQNRRFHADSSIRVQRWRAKQGKMLSTYIRDAGLLESLQNEAKFRGKPVWKLLRAAVFYGLPVARQRGWWRN